MRALAVLLLIFSALFAEGARAETRVALVLGISDYKTMAPRPNAAGDAHAIADLLKSVGFEVIEANDVSRAQFAERLSAFAAKADQADVALFYYAGQSLSLNGASYLLPVDANFKSEMDVKLGAAIALTNVIEQTMGHARTKIVLFDAGRINPFGRSSPPSTGVAANGETLIAFASAPGQDNEDGPKGGHSPFTQALLENIAAPGVGLQQVMTKVRARVGELTEKRQLAFGSDNLTRAVYLNPAPAK